MSRQSMIPGPNFRVRMYNVRLQRIASNAPVCLIELDWARGVLRCVSLRFEFTILEPGYEP